MFIVSSTADIFIAFVALHSGLGSFKSKLSRKALETRDPRWSSVPGWLFNTVMHNDRDSVLGKATDFPMYFSSYVFPLSPLTQLSTTAAYYFLGLVVAPIE